MVKIRIWDKYYPPLDLFYHGSFSSSTIPHYDPINQSKFKEVLYKKRVSQIGGQCVRRTTTIMLVGHKSPPFFSSCCYLSLNAFWTGYGEKPHQTRFSFDQQQHNLDLFPMCVVFNTMKFQSP